MDELEQKAWRAWLAEPSPPNAQAWAEKHSRSMERPEGVTPACELDFTESYGGPAHGALEQASETYLGRPLEEVTVEEFHWITESHFWAMQPSPSPRAMRGVRAFYADHDLSFPLGDEKTAEVHYNEANKASSELARLRSQISQLEQRNRKIKRALEHIEGRDTVKALQTEVTNLQHQLNSRAEENERLARALQGRAGAR